MKRLGQKFAGAVGLILILSVPEATLADSVPALQTPSGLSFAELKVTGDEYIILQNNSGAAITDLSSYWLENFNNYNPLAAGVSNSSQQLPSDSLDIGQTLLLSANPRTTCGAAVAGKLSVSLTDSTGFLELVQMTKNAQGAIDQTAHDAVSWSSGANGIIQKVPSNSSDANAVYYRTPLTQQNPNGWQLADLDATTACQLDIVTQQATPQPVQTGGLASGNDQPPATIISLASPAPTAASTPTLPAGDIGLKAPQITELLPNPNGVGNDNAEEFIEVYNSNDMPFDLNGFVLQTGTTTKHKFIFPAGTTLNPKSFTAFYSADTGLSLSNGGGQAQLLDPLGNQISQSDIYSMAKDGQAWTLANGNWYWTLSPTPNAANVVQQTGTSVVSKAGGGSSGSGAVKGASTASNNGVVTTGTASAADVAQMTPIHPWTLALVALLALLYGLYEYRADVANHIYQFRKHREARRIGRG